MTVLTKPQPFLRSRSEAFAPYLSHVCNIGKCGAVVLFHNAENGCHFPAANDAHKAFSLPLRVKSVGVKAGDATLHFLHNFCGNVFRFGRNNGDGFCKVTANEKKIRYLCADIKGNDRVKHDGKIAENNAGKEDHRRINDEDEGGDAG